MSVRNCTFPWHWMLVTQDGDVLPCGHGASAVGNLRDETVQGVWNGPLMQSVRASILADEVHDVCRTTQCPFQLPQPAFPERRQPAALDDDLALTFDEAWYLDAHADVHDAVAKRRLSSGLEHFIISGREEGRAFRRMEQPAPGARAHNAVLSLLEYTRGVTAVDTPPVDVVLAVTTVCNLRCVMCPHGMRLVERPRSLPDELAAKTFAFVDSASRVILSGVGEPMLSAAFWTILRRTAGRTDLFMRVNSNAHFVTAENAELILDSGLSEISFSLDAATHDTYAKIRGADFERALNGVETLVRARRRRTSSKLEIFVNMTLMRENIAEAEPFVHLGKALGADAAVFSQLFAFGERPDWQVAHYAGTFVYEEQVLARQPDVARRNLAAAEGASRVAGLPVRYIDNVDSYLRTEDLR